MKINNIIIGTILLCIPVLRQSPNAYAFPQDLLFDQSATGLCMFWQSMSDSVYPFESRVADNFSVPYDAQIDSLIWWGGYWSMQTNQIVDFQIEFYEDSSGYSQPKQEPVYAERVAFSEIDLGGYYRYEASIPQFTILNGQTYWIVFMARLVFPPHWGNNCSWPANSPGWGDGQESYFKSSLFGYDVWVSASSVLDDPYESSYQIFGSPEGINENLNIINQDVSWLIKANQNPVTCDRVIFTCNTIQHQPVSLHILDCTGRYVKTVLSSKQSAGANTLVWNLKDNHDFPVSNGVYFAVYRASTKKAILKLVIQR